MKGEFSLPVGGYFVTGREVPRWLKRFDFSSCSDEADKRRDVDMLSFGPNRLMSKKA